MEPLRTVAAALAGGLLALAPGAAAGPPVAALPAVPAPDARLVAEWDPGWSAAEAGGRFTVDGYGVGGLGAYGLGLGDGAVVLAVCVQADVGHSTTIDYRRDASPTVASPELDYLLWRMSGPPAMADDLTAAATNVLAWRYAGAVRSTGGTIWSGDRVEVAVRGVGRRPEIEAAIVTLHAEATRRRGPWTLSQPVRRADGSGYDVRVAGPGGPIAGVVVAASMGSTRWTVTTEDDGVARVDPPAGATGTLVVTSSGPGPARTWSAPGSQRVAVAGAPLERRVEVVVAAAPTTTTTTTVAPTTSTSTTTTTTTTVAPTTSTSTTMTVAPTTSTSTVPPTTSTSTTTMTVPPTTSTSTTTTTTTTAVPSTSTTPSTTAVPPTTPSTSTVATPTTTPSTTLAATGAGVRPWVRAGAWAVALGGLAVLLGARRRGAVGQDR